MLSEVWKHGQQVLAVFDVQMRRNVLAKDIGGNSTD